MNVIARISFGLRRVGGDQVGDPVGEHAGLARAGAGEDQQRPLAVRDRLALGLVEPREQRVEVGAGSRTSAAVYGSDAGGGQRPVMLRGVR